VIVPDWTHPRTILDVMARNTLRELKGRYSLEETRELALQTRGLKWSTFEDYLKKL
jgi:hypothetical protein